MQIIQSVNQKFFQKVPKVKVGQTVKVHQKIKEGDKTRIQIFEGLVIKVSSGSGTAKTFTVRKVFQGIGVEKIFPFHSPNIAKIEVTKSSKVRRAKLYYMRELTGKAARLKERILSAKDLEEMDKDLLEEVAEEVVEEPIEESAEQTEEQVTETTDSTPEQAEETAEEAAPATEEAQEETKEEQAEAPAEEPKAEEKAEEEKEA